MGRRSQTKTLAVSMNGVPVGDLTRRPGGILEFSYRESWLAEASATPISLSIPLSSDPRRGDVVATYFDNLMPDSPEVRQRLQTAVGADSPRAFDLLMEIGGDCVGALQFHSSEDPPSVRTIQSEPWTDAQVARHLKEMRGRPPVNRGRAKPFRSSLAGAQEKTALLRTGDGWCKPLGPTPTTHIFKPAMGATAAGIDLSTSVENEWLCSRILRAFGLRAASSEVLQFEDERVLCVERFDRALSADGTWWMRRPQEDMCQATGTPAGKKYEQDGGPGFRTVLEILAGATSPIEDRLHFLRSQLVFWLLAAIDGHGKNFSLALLPGAGYRLTPLYDVLSAHPAIESGDLHEKELSMAMALEGKNRRYKWLELRPEHWLESARRAGLSNLLVNGAIDAVVSAVPRVVEATRVDADKIDPRVGEPILTRMTLAAERFKRLR